MCVRMYVVKLSGHRKSIDLKKQSKIHAVEIVQKIGHHVLLTVSHLEHIDTKYVILVYTTSCFIQYKFINFCLLPKSN